ncbi:AAA family ATPase [Lentzea tibetensis]|uniref:AAA family ATPase n=2 Tax=Lentzea tibetensis TaxID=2591470 RepID=A0A563F2L3_9PSEU|nr:AAA family ATPase [Lentzea tibetensis]
MVGRRHELDALAAWLDGARAGAGRLVLCSGEPGIGKTRLAQELAGLALAGGTAVAWGRCVETEGAPAFWPWRQVLRSLGADPDAVFAGNAEPEDRFRIFDDVARLLTGRGELVVVLDDLHWADEPSQRLLRHLADQLTGAKLLVFAAYRERVLPDLLRSPDVGRLDLRGFGLAEVRELTDPGDAAAILELTGGNPLFVREVALAMADGTWRPDRPPRTVLDVVTARLDLVSADCRALVQAAAIAGRDFDLGVVAAAIGRSVQECLPLFDEAVAMGLADEGHRFVHALTRDAVEASLSSADRIRLHRAVAEATQARFAGDLAEHVTDIARHWAVLAPCGEAATARAWTVRAAEEAVRRLAYEEGVRLYQAALALDPGDTERARLRIALGRAAYFAGDLATCVDAAQRAADAARAVGKPELLGEAALVLEAAADGGLNAAATPLCEEALAVNPTGALRARLLAQRAHLAFYAGEQHRLDALSTEALELARASGDDRALVDALRARQEACPGPHGIAERLDLAAEMRALAVRTNSPRTAMWGELWRIQALLESGSLAAAAELLPALRLAVARVGGPVSAWHLGVVTACVAQAQGRYDEARDVARGAFERMRTIEPAPARGAYMALRCALARMQGPDEESIAHARAPFEPPPRFRMMALVSRSFLLLTGGFPDEAAEVYRRLGRIEDWELPAFFEVPAHVMGVLVTAGLGLKDDLASLLQLLEPFRGAHAIGLGVAYMGPVDLALGIGAAALGDHERAAADLTAGLAMAERAGAPGFAAEARRHLAKQPSVLSPRETEVAALVADGLTNRQIAERLYISERTAQNHVQHVLTKLGFATRSQIAAWSVRMSTPVSGVADGGAARTS